MKFIIQFVILICLCGCTTATKNTSSKLAHLFIGQWEWEEGPKECSSLVNMAFRRDGTYTRTSESCDFADDGFGNFYYGWFVANEHLCFVSIEEQFKDEGPRKKLYKELFHNKIQEGFKEENCSWKIEIANKNKITITEKYNDSESTTFTMVRKKWL
jgi:hypothetical protein